MVHDDEEPSGPRRPEVGIRHAQQRSRGQVERRLQLIDPGGKRDRLLGVRPVGHVQPRHGRRTRRCDLLVPAGRPLLEAEAERVMLPHEVIDGLLQRRLGEWFAHVDQHGLIPVVRLRSGRLEEPALYGGQGDRPRPVRGGGLRHGGLGGRAGRGGEFGDRLVAEDLPRAEPQAGLCGARDNLQAADRVAPQLEEVVVDADRRDAENACPDVGEKRFSGRARRHVAQTQRGPGMSGMGSARRSSLPVGVSGSVSSQTKTAGTM